MGTDPDWLHLQASACSCTAAHPPSGIMTQQKHNPLKLPSGQKIDLAACFVNPWQDANHRCGFDLIVDDCGFGAV